jgi:lipopolysaccharide transport system ATP-binding protein
MSTALQFDHVSKRYDSHYYRTLRDSITGIGSRLRGKRLPAPVELALQDVNFTITEGESVAIIGRNGAGKTTALKLATRILYPTEGVIRVRGRVGALIEVGTGMHPELNGRENIQLFGRILGFKPSEIDRRFDEIVSFAGLERALDHPVKYYSSGMQLRLGFSLAAHLEPDVLMVDEAIAVGDAGFQYRCIERMREVVRSGRTLVFVSHDLGAVEALCDRVILLDRGQVTADGPPQVVIRDYLAAVDEERMSETPEEDQHGPLTITGITLLDSEGRDIDRFEAGESLTARLHYRALEPVRRPIFSVGIGQGRLGCFAVASTLADGMAQEILSGDGALDCTFESLPLTPGTFEVWVSVRGEAGYGDLVDWRPRKVFQVVDDVSEAADRPVPRAVAEGPVKIPYHWSSEAHPGRSTGEVTRGEHVLDL